jgi:hypothetical protein
MPLRDSTRGRGREVHWFAQCSRTRRRSTSDWFGRAGSTAGRGAARVRGAPLRRAIRGPVPPSAIGADEDAIAAQHDPGRDQPGGRGHARRRSSPATRGARLLRPGRRRSLRRAEVEYPGGVAHLSGTIDRAERMTTPLLASGLTQRRPPSNSYSTTVSGGRPTGGMAGGIGRNTMCVRRCRKSAVPCPASRHVSEGSFARNRRRRAVPAASVRSTTASKSGTATASHACGCRSRLLRGRDRGGAGRGDRVARRGAPEAPVTSMTGGR